MFRASLICFLSGLTKSIDPLVPPSVNQRLELREDRRSTEPIGDGRGIYESIADAAGEVSLGLQSGEQRLRTRIVSRVADSFVTAKITPTAFMRSDFVQSWEAQIEGEFCRMEYSEDFLMNLGRRTRNLLRRQLERDELHRDFTPNLRRAFELVPTNEKGVHQVLALGRLLSRTTEATIFEIKDRPDLLIKYQADCGSLLEGDLVHPLIREGWFLTAAAALGLAPRMHFLSPATLLGSVITPKTDFRMALSKRSFFTETGTLRYMVMDRAGPSLYAYYESYFSSGKRPSLPFTVNVLVEVFMGLRELHARGLVHADIHPGNVLINLKTEGDVPSSLVQFIDFGKSFISEERENHPVLIAPPFTAKHALFSHWDIAGIRPSFRDDAFRALWMGSFMMNGQTLSEYCNGLDTPLELFLFKRDEFWFDIPGQPSVLDSLPEELRTRIREHLSDILRLVRQSADISSVPDYDDIVHHLRSILELLSS